MKRLLASGLVITAVATTMFAKTNGFATMKKMEIKKLESKISLMEKRLKCVEGAKSSKELAICKSKYPLLNKNNKIKGKIKSKKAFLKNKKHKMKDKVKSKVNSKKSALKSKKDNLKSKVTNKINSFSK